MAQQSTTLDLSKTEILEAAENLEHPTQVPVKRSWGALILAAVEAACLFAVTALKAGPILGPFLGTLAGWTGFVHQNIIRIPILLLAVVGSSYNLFLLRRAQRLRNLPAAAWRKRPLTRKERWKIILVLTASILTLIVVGMEIYLHQLIQQRLL